jgi:hypothetical protein
MLLETTFGWDLDNNAVNLIDEDDEVHMNPHQLIALLCNVSVRKLTVLLLKVFKSVSRVESTRYRLGD